VLVKKLGEVGLIERIRRNCSKGARDRDIIVPMGDDAFAARLSPGCALVSTKDLLIENVHFKREWTSPFDLGYKSIAVNISDLAAMGRCRPRYALVGIGLPGDIGVDYVNKLYTGMNTIAAKYGLTITGGDTVSSKKDIVISITLIGEAKKEDLLTRGGALPGDSVFVTGTLGDSAAGLFLLEKGIRQVRGDAGYLLKRHRRPEPRLEAAHRLTATGLLTSMIDSSDGLAASVGFISSASRVGVRIDLEKIPLSRQLRALGRRYRSVDSIQMALTGGEDYELVFTARSGKLSRLRAAYEDIALVGEITKGRDVTYYFNGSPKKVATAGFQHFKS
jgi:thiamine-monophosphate kinase